ncbi:MAG: PP2C family serine/threonine-protein phosphatase [Myxococcota bacterium]
MSTSVVGSDHVRAGLLVLVDAALAATVAVGDEQRLVVAVSDGAGSARFPEVGAHIACVTALASLSLPTLAPPATGDGERALAERLVADIQQAIGVEAELRGAALRDFACTLLAAVVAPEWCLFLQIGDGAIVVSEAAAPASYAWVFWPGKAEHVNETSFVTGSDAAQRIDVAWRSAVVDEVAIFTDGLERLALDFANKVAHPAFFAPMLAAIRPIAAHDTSELQVTTAELSAFLGSERINERTGDDKTLVLATRRGV